MEKTIEHEMETGGTLGVKELNLRYYIVKAILITMCAHYGNLI